ncbi:MAG TPA: tetratricopeptide repeat protein [Pyrinomonadaceae bacterium]|jgi:tetratricopeptide (TPR) repeat protein/CHAT domain-containing protein
MSIKILDFHLTKRDGGFRLDVYPRDASQPLAGFDFNFPRSLLTEAEWKHLDFDTKDPAGRVERLRDFGRRLYEQIFTQDIARLWTEHKQNHEFLVLCLRIATDANELEAIAWETLFDSEEFIAAGTKTTISRLPLDVQPQAALAPIPLPLKMLALVSSPLDLREHSRLQMEREQEILLEAINDPAGQGRIRADFEDEAKLEILEGSLETPYQIFHFTGHGIAPENGGGLLLEDARGESRPTSVAEVLQSLQRGENHLRLVVLSGCQTSRTINVEGFRDMARGLLRHRIPAVIAMQFSISDMGGLKFAEALYKRIADGRTLELASHGARRALLLSDDYYLQADALAPVLLTSNGACLQTTQAEAAPAFKAPIIDRSFYLPLAQLSYGFYGRRREFRQVRDGLLRQNQRAVIVHGIGGIGKTALVSHVATRLKKNFRGVYAFDCSSGTLTPETVMIKLHQYFQPQGVPVLEQLLYQNLPPDVLANYLAQVLSQWSLLLIFDNFESHLEHNGAGFRIADEHLRTFITTLVKTTATQSHFLFTSRYLFELDDKRLGSIQSLPLEDLSRPEALSLMQKLQHLAPASHPEKLAALQTFGGHPYALVTLDRYCNHQPLSRALADAKNIHTELRAFLAIELNYAQLSAPSRELLNRLAAFRQSVPYESAEWVMGTKVSYAAEFLEKNRDKLSEELKSLDEAEILQRLESVLPEQRQTEDLTHPIRELIEWGLLTPIQENGQPKALSIHALVRNFCHDKQQGETWHERLRDAAAFYTNFTKLTEPKDKTQVEVWVEMEAFELLVEAKEFNDAADLLIDATELLDRWGFGQYLEGQYHRLFDKLDPPRTAGFFHNLGILIQSHGNYDKALEYYERSLKIAEELDDQSGIANLLNQFGIIHYKRGEYDKALEYYEQSLRIAEELDEQSGIATSLHQIGMIHQRRGNHAKALEYYERSLKIAEESDHHSGIAASLHQIGNIHQQRGEHDKALEHYERSLKIKEELGDRSGIASSLHQIGIIHQTNNEYEQALKYYTRSLQIEEELGARSGIAQSLHQIGMVYENRGDYEKALEHYGRSLKIKEELGDRQGISISLGKLGTLFANSGHFDRALQYSLAALSLCIELGSPNANVAANDLMKLRAKWGGENFDPAWREATGEDVPDWLKG